MMRPGVTPRHARYGVWFNMMQLSLLQVMYVPVLHPTPV